MRTEKEIRAKLNEFDEKPTISKLIRIITLEWVLGKRDEI